MKTQFIQLIEDFHYTELKHAQHRMHAIPHIPEHLRKAVALIGMRRSGKTWLLYQWMHALLAQGVDKKQMLYINFEDDRLAGIQTEDFQSLLDAYFELYPEYTDTRYLHFFFDEIHEAPNWEKFIRRLLDTEHMQIYITGSSAKMLSTEIATSLRGRTLTYEVFPLNFIEFLDYHKVDTTQSSKNIAVILHHLRLFLKQGGFPETVGLENYLRNELIQNYIDSVIYRDIIERHQVQNSSALRHLITHALQNAASPLSINKIYKKFKSLGFSIGKNTLYQWMDYLEDAYALIQVPCFHFSQHKMRLKPRKIYPIDQGMITAYSIKPDHDEGTRFETMVFRHLREGCREIYYYHTDSGKEVDFLTKSPKEEIALYQASISLQEEETRIREISALEEAMKELDCNTGHIVTLEEEETLQTELGTIYILPAWKWMLGIHPH